MSLASPQSAEQGLARHPARACWVLASLRVVPRHLVCAESGPSPWTSPATCLQTADQLLARADAAKALAEEAAKKGRNTLQEANDILNNLKGTTGSGDGVKRLLPPQGRVPAFFSFLFSRDSLNIHRMKDNIVVPPCPWGILSRTPSGHLKSCIVPNPRYALLFPVPTCDDVNL